ncbi:hypothetical protein WA158_007175 [Blastocystis sp. Blastoise]
MANKNLNATPSDSDEDYAVIPEKNNKASEKFDENEEENNPFLNRGSSKKVQNKKVEKKEDSESSSSEDESPKPKKNNKRQSKPVPKEETHEDADDADELNNPFLTKSSPICNKNNNTSQESDDTSSTHQFKVICKELKSAFTEVNDLLESIPKSHPQYSPIHSLKRQIKMLFDEARNYVKDPSKCTDEDNFMKKAKKCIADSRNYNQEDLLQYKSPSSAKSDDIDSDSDDTTTAMNSLDDDDEFLELESETGKYKHACYKEINNLILHSDKGRLSSTQVFLPPNGQASIPIPVTVGTVVAFTWKEKHNSRLLFRAILSVPNNANTQEEIIPLKVRISSYQYIYECKKEGVIRLGWDNSLSVRKGKELDVWVRQFTGVDGQIVLEEEEDRRQKLRGLEIKELTKGSYEGGNLTCKLTSRTVTANGVKYYCHCDWEGILNHIQISWDVFYAYKEWYEWYCDIKAKYPANIAALPPFTGTAMITTKAVIEERLTKINIFLQELVKDRFLMNTIEVNNWLKWSENIRRAKPYDNLREKREKERQREEEEERQKEEEERRMKETQINENKPVTPAVQQPEDCFDPLSYLAM